MSGEDGYNDYSPAHSTPCTVFAWVRGVGSVGSGVLGGKEGVFLMITLHGPDWPTIRTLRTILTEVSESGTFTLGGRPTGAIEQLTAFRAAGLLTPDFTTSRTEAIGWVETGSIVFGRRLFHTRGNDICLPPRKIRYPHGSGIKIFPIGRWTESEWWSRYIPPTEEWRVHVFNGRSIARGKKVHSGNSWRKAPIRNIGNGWTFDFTADPPRGLRRTAKAAVAALGYPHGAVDILQVGPNAPGAANAQETVFYVLEVNRCPALTCPYTQGAWVSAIRRHVRGEVGNDN